MTVDDRSDLARKILQGLLAAIRPSPEAEPRWDSAEPYLLRQAIAHAADAGTVDELLGDPEFLVHAAPDTLLPELRRASTEEARLLAAIYRASAQTHGSAEPGVRRQLLGLDAARYGALTFAERLARPQQVPLDLWTPAWCTSAQVDAALLATIPCGAWSRSIAVASLGGRQVAVVGGDNQMVSVYDLLSTEEVGLPLRGPLDVVRSVTTGTIQGRTVVLAGDDSGMVHVWDLTSGELFTTFRASDRVINAIASVSLNGMTFVATGGDDRIIRLWNMESGESREFTGHQGGVSSLAWESLHDRPVLASGGLDATVRLWDPEAEQEIRVLAAGESWIHSVSFLKRNREVFVVSCGTDGVVRAWHTETDEPPVAIFTGNTSLGAVAPVPGDTGHLVCAGQDGAVKVIDLNAPEAAPVLLTGHTLPVGALATAVLNGRHVALSGGGDEMLRLWDLPAALAHRTAVGHTGDVRALALAEDATALFSGGDDGTVRRWDLTTGAEVGTILLSAGLDRRAEESVAGSGGDEVHALAVASVDGRPLFVASLGASHLLSCAYNRGTLPSELRGHQDVVSAVSTLAFDDRVVAVSGGDDALLRVWDLRTDGLLTTLAGHNGWINAVDTLLMDRPLAVSAGDDGAVLLWDLETHQQRGLELRDDSDSINAVVLASLEGEPFAAAAGDDGLIRVWNLSAGRVSRVVAGHEGAVRALAVLRLAEPVLVSGGDDGVLRFWDLATGRRRAAYRLPDRITAIVAGPENTVAVGFGWEVAVFTPTGPLA